MRNGVLALAALACMALAGCTGGTDEPTLTTQAVRQLDEGVDRVDVPLLPREAPAPGTRTTAAPPEWRLGEFWEYAITDHFAGNTITTTRVVAGTDGGNYLVGFPLEAFDNDVLIFHMPGYGDVSQADLSFEAHDVVYAPLKFPLTAGESWPTAWEGISGTATVLSATPQQAEVRIVADNGGYDITATYDAEMGEIIKVAYPGYMDYEVTRHGYGYTGLVRVPHAHDLVFQNGRLGPWDIQQNIVQDAVPADLQDTVEVGPGYDRLAFTIIVGGGPSLLVPEAQGTPSGGYFKETVTAPNGTVFMLEQLPNETGLKIQFFGTGDPVGTWTLDHQAGGAGIVLTEGIGYHSIDIELPSGCVLRSQNALHHTTLCKADEQGQAQMAATTSTAA
ncbi:MAG: hypothetical protein QOD77_1711 [Thermoplasmata archaeon]|jgi:hypothetical protein|nr:hypothetical protein [Thermoplasmata archaeon]